MDPDLQHHLRRLAARQNNLERRLQRIESSIVFRFLRWLGLKLAALGLPVPGVLPPDEADAYQVWIRETVNHVEPGTRQPTISVILNAAQSDPVHLERALASLREQTYKACEPFVCSEGNSSALEKIHSDAVLFTNSNVILDPDALRSFAAALDDTTVAVYSDWDHIDPGGRRHSPRFTPEFSPELLRQTQYWGSCYLVAASHVHEMPWFNALCTTASYTTREIRRIPRMLWHSQEPATIPSKTPVRHPPSAARASIIICTRNPERLARCLEALRPTLDPRHEIMVVAHEVNLQPIDGVKIAPYRGAFHFGLMNAQGVQESTGDVLCFLNDDVFPSTSDWLERMLAQAARPDVGIVGALLLYPDGSIQHAGVVVDRWHPAHVGRFQKDSPYWPWLRMTREVSAVTGACMVLRRSTWNELGGFDLQFPVNYNDIDLCLRAAQHGYRVLIETQAVLVHEEARTRVAVVRPEEAERFHQRWSAVTDRPDPYFNPQLSTEDETIALPAPWTAVR